MYHSNFKNELYNNLSFIIYQVFQWIILVINLMNVGWEARQVPSRLVAINFFFVEVESSGGSVDGGGSGGSEERGMGFGM